MNSNKRCILCSATSKDLSLSFHRFPTEKIRRNAWVKACNLNENDVRVQSVLCSKHFIDLDFNCLILSKRTLHKEAVPSVHIPGIHSNTNANLQESTLQKATPIQQSTSADVDWSDKVKDEPMLSDTLSEAGSSGGGSVPRIPRYIGDLRQEHFATPRRAKRNLEFVNRTVNEQRKKLRTLTMEKQKLEKSIHNLKDLLKTLRDETLLSEESSAAIMAGTPDAIKYILDRQFQSKNSKFSPELRSFALTLHYYSPSAYNFVREAFHKLLPHPETIREWYLVVEGAPGFTKESFDTIKLYVKNSRLTPLVNIVIDEMSVRQLVEYVNGRYYGYVDLGLGVEKDGDDKEEDLATNALTFMAVSLNSHWKIALGYFLIRSLTSDERANLMNQCLELLKLTGAHFNSVTFDGASVNIKMCSVLGANFDPLHENFQPWFPGPLGTPVHTFWDACHMAKLVRGTLAEREELTDSENGCIQWRHIVELEALQRREGLQAGTKLTSRHINYKNEKMKVKLAVQTLSCSVSNALLFCKKLQLPQFEHAEPTAKFCLIMNNIFDILNSRNLIAKSEFARGLSPKTYDLIFETANVYINYIKGLKDNLGNLLIASNRKTGFVGYIVCLTSLVNLYKDTVIDNYLRFILTYKLSQDHLETFFSSLRRRGGWDNNPSARNFQSAYKRLLVKNQIRAATNGNCEVDSTAILYVASGTRIEKKEPLISDTCLLDVSQQDHDYFCDIIKLSPYQEHVIEYISGFVVKQVVSKVTCHICVAQLHGVSCSSLLQLEKTRGNLMIASESVIAICKTLETAVREHKNNLSAKNIINQITSTFYRRNRSEIFCNPEMDEHIRNQDILDNHKTELVKTIIKIFLKVRLHYEAKRINLDSNNNRIRSKFTKLILFKNQ